MLLNDQQIKRLALEESMIVPFTDHLERIQQREDGTEYRVISRFLSSFGYDLTLSPNEFRIFRHIPGTIVNPKAFNPDNLIDAPLHEDKWGKYFILPANSYGLGVSMERLSIPRNITALFIGKSTYARSGIIVNLTPGESLWRGHLTIEISNASSADCRIYAGEGICQALFFEGEPCETAYDDRHGKYQDQPASVVLARV
jgi:dCTP deaminase